MVVVCGEAASICPECSYKWTHAPPASVSSPCPEAGGLRTKGTFVTSACAIIATKQQRGGHPRPERAIRN
jgi:hypothetical protein